MYRVSVNTVRIHSSESSLIFGPTQRDFHYVVNGECYDCSECWYAMMWFLHNSSFLNSSVCRTKRKSGRHGRKRQRSVSRVTAMVTCLPPSVFLPPHSARHATRASLRKKPSAAQVSNMHYSYTKTWCLISLLQSAPTCEECVKLRCARPSGRAVVTNASNRQISFNRTVQIHFRYSLKEHGFVAYFLEFLR